MNQADGAPGGTDESRLPVQPRNYLRPCLLLLLQEEPTYGYELRSKLAPLSAGHWDPGTVYRTLNTMEDDELVRSTWERSAEGPRRRLYQITDAGSAVLDDLTRDLCGLRNMVIEFIERYESHHEGRLTLPSGTVRIAEPAPPRLAAAGRPGNGRVHRSLQPNAVAGD